MYIFRHRDQWFIVQKGVKRVYESEVMFINALLDAVAGL